MPKHLPGVGEPAPWFTARSTNNPKFHFHTMAGRYVVLAFFGSAAGQQVQELLAEVVRRRACFDDENACFFGVSCDPEDESSGRVKESLPGLRYFWDFDREVSRAYGVAGDGPGGEPYRPHTLVLDPRLRVVGVLALGDAPADHVGKVVELLRRLPPVGPVRAATVQAPILVVPYLFEPELCKTLIDYYERHGGRESGFMREVGGKTVELHDAAHKKRRDQEIEDEGLRKACVARIHARLVPEIHTAYQFQATRIERYLVACYDAESGGHFRAHRDNTTKGTAHRRFAVSLNLNTGAYEGGMLRFPEFGPQVYTAPAGGAVVFSCSLLHEATPVTRGKRYAFLPFLYDEAAAKIRDENRQYLAAAAPEEAGPG
jgi:peroxiredoxin/predicted 2-oxoglutarate/Fe(II)-dependent dioxygenase YbiX